MPVSVREALTSALTGRDGQDITEALLGRLDDHYTVRRVAATALAGRDGQDVTDALLARLDDSKARPARGGSDARWPGGKARTSPPP